MNLPRHKTKPRRLRPVIVALAVLIAALGVGFASTAGAKRATIIGKTDRAPKPNCPSTALKPCQVMGHVTGFQRSAAGKKNLFKVRRDGKIVAWSVDLARPNKEEQSVFRQFGGTDRYGNGPTAGISIIKRRSDGKFRLKRRSPVVKVGSYMGERPVITLARPLRVSQGDIVALTTPTWLPNFASGLPRRNVWKASRRADRCNAPDAETFFEQSRPHTKVGSDRRYGCTYNRARLLYWAYLVPRG